MLQISTPLFIRIHFSLSHTHKHTHKITQHW